MMNATSLRQLAAILLTGVTLFFAACTKDVYEPKDPTPTPEEKVSQELKDFGFATQGTVALSVDYNVSGFRTLIKVYAENPLDDSNNLKEGLEPVFVAYTDNNAKYEGKMYIPKAVKEAYLYTNRWGLPLCVKLDYSESGFSYDASQVELKATTKAALDIFKENVPYEFGYTEKSRGTWLRSLCKWDINGDVRVTATGINYLSSTKKVGDETSGAIAARIQNHFSSTPNRKEFLSDASVTNITVTSDNTTLDVMFLAEQAQYYNTLGYYYYKQGNAPSSRKAMHEMKKYVVFPNLTNAGGYSVLATGSTARLQFFGENYDQPATEKFPSGYVIGWFFISNGFNDESYGSLRNMPLAECDYNPIYFSNDVNQFKRFVSLDDKKSKIVVLGFEDQPNIGENEDYCDALFYIKASKKIDNDSRPNIPDEGKEDEDIEGEIPTYSSFGTVGFEDIWPSGGDYDLNDVAVEYDRELSFDRNNSVTSVVETFKFVQNIDAASFNNYFAFQANNLGTVEADENCIVEGETGSVVITKFAKNLKDKIFTVKRSFNSGLTSDVVLADFNPYIITNVAKDDEGRIPSSRKEVHLPMLKGTSKAETVDASKNTYESYYMDKTGKFPYAICVPVKNFKLSSERQNIGITYPSFNTWAESFGKDNQGWYK